MAAVTRESWISFAVCVFTGGIVFFDTLRYPKLNTQGFGQGPGFYPQLLAGVLICLGVLIPLNDLRTPSPGMDRDSDRPRYGVVVSFTGLSLALVLLMQYLGFMASGFLFMLLSVFLVKPGRDRWNGILPDLGVSLGIMVLIYLLFECLVGIELPGAVFGG